MMVQLLKTYWKSILIAILALFLLVSVNSCNRNKQAIKELNLLHKANDSIASSLIEQWKDKYGKEHATVENLKITSDIKIKEVESAATTLNIKSKQITGFAQTSNILKLKENLRIDSITTILPCAEDSISVVRQYKFNWKDAWINISGTVGDSNNINLAITDTITKIDYWKRKWFLGAKTYYSDIQNYNPHITTTGYKGIQKVSKQKQWSIGLDLQVGYPFNQPINFTKPVISAGISLQRTFIRF